MNATIGSLKLFILLSALTGSVYFAAFQGGFHYDDSWTILENPHLDRWRTFVGHLDHMVRPVLYGTFLLDRSLYRTNPAGYHLLNVLLHLGSGILIYLILTRAVTERQSSVPFWTALLFLIHPIATETVTYLSGRTSGLMTFFYLSAFLLYVKTLEPSGTVKLRRLYLSGAVASFALSIGSKETAVTLPIMFLLWDMVIRGLKGPSLQSAVLSRYLPFGVVLLFAVGWAWSHPRYAGLAQFSLTIRPLWDNLLSELHAWAYALALFFTPWNQNFDHDLPVFHSLTQWPLPLDLLLLSATFAAGLFSWRRFPLAAFGLGWFFIQLLPTSLIPRNDLLSERNLYLPSIGLLLAIVTLGSYLAQRLAMIVSRPRLVQFASMSVATAFVIVLCLFTFQRNQLYQNRVSFWSDTVLKSPNKARPHNNLGYAYALEGDWDRAIEEFRTAAKLDPDFMIAQQNLRDAYLHRLGRQ
ncbi:MAG: tetratricopeptide repeat protein [Nitrospira sp.]